MGAPILPYQNSEDIFILDTDASNDDIGDELIQVQNWVCSGNRFCSFVLDSVHRNYCTTRKVLFWGGAVYRFNRSIALGQILTHLLIWSGPWIVTQVISSVLSM